MDERIRQIAREISELYRISDGNLSQLEKKYERAEQHILRLADENTELAAEVVRLKQENSALRQQLQTRGK